MTLPIYDLRQSPNWARYLESLGWKSVRTSNGINISIRTTFVGGMVKVQKPAPISVEDIVEVEKICRDHKALFIKFEPYIGQDITVFQNAGYWPSSSPLTPSATYYIHLDKSEDELWNNISHSGKYSIHRTQREGTRVVFLRNPSKEALSTFYKVLKFTGHHKKFYIPPIDQLYLQAEAFGDDGFLVTTYDKDDNLCGGKWHVGYRDLILYVSGGTSELGRHNKSGYELLWRSILYFKSLGYKTFDLEGKDDPRFPGHTISWGGFTHFKEKFGGEVIEFPYPQIKYFNPVMRFLDKRLGFGL